MLKRAYNLSNLVKAGRVLVIYGARRVGKTTILKDYLAKISIKYRLDSGDNIILREMLSSEDFGQIKAYADAYDLIAIDEAQQIPGIGQALKIMVDNFSDLKIIVTGSASFNLPQNLGEPLTGRKQTITLFPLSQQELSNYHSRYDLRERLPQFLIYGSYPEVVLADNDRERSLYLRELSESYLLKDVLALDNIRFSKKLIDLLKALAFQIGNLVSLNELSRQVGLEVKTVERYLDLLEKGFVIKRLGGFSRNLRNEINSKAKYFFWDNGIRNALISQFNDLGNRDDIGALWENFLVTEFLKKNSYGGSLANHYFWRNYAGKEIDLIVENNGELAAYECKWSKGKASLPNDFAYAYPKSSFTILNKDNYLDFIL